MYGVFAAAEDNLLDQHCMGRSFKNWLILPSWGGAESGIDMRAEAKRRGIHSVCAMEQA